MKKPGTSADAFDERGQVRPDPEDYAWVANEPDDPSKTEEQNLAKKYRLAQSRKLIRLYEAGLLPVKLMRKFDRMVADKRDSRRR
jgi:hypothetical protein